MGQEEVMDLAPTPLGNGDRIGLLGKRRPVLGIHAEWAEPLLESLYSGEGAVGTIHLCRLVGCSYRQIDYWCRMGLIIPIREANGSGSQRLFDLEGVRTARIVTRLSAIGIQPGFLLEVGIDNSVELLAEELQSILDDLVGSEE